MSPKDRISAAKALRAKLVTAATTPELDQIKASIDSLTKSLATMRSSTEKWDAFVEKAKSNALLKNLFND